MTGRAAWIPCLVLLVGSGFVYGGVHRQVSMPLDQPLDTTVPMAFDGLVGRDIPISEEEQEVAGMDSFVLREYSDPATGAALASVYVGYYTQQTQGNTIHSPKNCLPGGGWEPLVSSQVTLATAAGAATVTRWLIGNGPAKAVVLYWYQGRGRVQANEYAVKWDLLRDQALHGRSDEALVRVIVPVQDTEQAAFEQAVRIAEDLVIAVNAAVPS